MDISVITPAHNEEQHLGKCIDSVKAAAEHASLQVEHIVVLNRCTDRTEEIAVSGGCRIAREDARIISRIRNAGVREAQGKIVITIDADSWMSPNMISEVVRNLESGRFVGGGVRVYLERLSLGIFCSVMVVVPFVLLQGVSSAGMFWCYKNDFDEIGGFDESFISVEDVDFAKRLKALGRTRGQRYGTIRKAHITTSCRKFDLFGDWYLVRNPKVVYDIFKRKQKVVDDFYYNVRSDIGEDAK